MLLGGRAAPRSGRAARAPPPGAPASRVAGPRPRSRPGVLVLINDEDWELRWVSQRFLWSRVAAARAAHLTAPTCCRPRPRPAPRSGTLASAVEEGDRITFISTLHGG
jgi:hypothetical protein